MEQHLSFRWKARGISPGDLLRSGKEGQIMILIMRFVIKWIAFEVKISCSRKRRWS